jgi:hypothetical protein
MHVALLISASLGQGGHLPSLSTVLISLPVLGFLLFVGSRSAFKSSSKGKAADRVLTNQLDDKGVPLFFDVDSQDGGAYTSARAVCRTRVRPR